ncbi:P-loop ATPase, Sll1717 family [Hoeflea ulvae]|uniref:ATPase n=1 Tax=Hoeflea ulvae TaxID=2983764 RepID=A0ABT3YKL2_9HYPH|nr:hypothetical protein [Hoeflea ulvae]MCY0096441.1 hypothetical protein [Hoeflea ulvae]
MDQEKSNLLSSLLKKTDGRADDQVLEYTHDTESMSTIATAAEPISLVLGLKGIGKSTAFKYFTQPTGNPESEMRVFRLGFSPGSDQLLKLSKGTSGEYRERLYNILLMSAISFFRANNLTPRSKARQFLSKIEDIIGPVEGPTEVLFSQARARLTGAFGFKFDLSEDVDARIQNFDREASRELFASIRAQKIRVHYFFDDPEMLLGTEKTGWDALAGLVQAADQVNTNFGGVFDVTVLLKSHLYRRVMDYEETANIFPARISSLTWGASDLSGALKLRLNAAGVKLSDFIDETGVDIERDVFANLRSGPRDLFVWLALAFEEAGRKKICKLHLEKTLPAAGKHSMQQITSGYKDIVSDIQVILRELFSNQSELSYQELLAAIQERRVNSVKFQSADAKNEFDIVEKYVDFLTECGCLLIKLNGVTHFPYTHEYIELLEEPEALNFELHPMLRSHLMRTG